MALALHDVQTCEANSRPEQLEPEDKSICVLQDAVPNPRIFMDHFPLDLFPALARCPAIVAFGLDLVFCFLQVVAGVGPRLSLDDACVFC